MSDNKLILPDSARTRRLSHQEIVLLAQDCFARRVFGSWQFLSQHDEKALMASFPCLMLATPEQRQAMRDNGVAHVYEFTRLARPERAEGDYPVFNTCRYLYKDDSDLLHRELRRLNSAVISRAAQEEAAKEMGKGDRA
jgi:hypothetical protein